MARVLGSGYSKYWRKCIEGAYESVAHLRVFQKQGSGKYSFTRLLLQSSFFEPSSNHSLRIRTQKDKNKHNRIRFSFAKSHESFRCHREHLPQMALREHISAAGFRRFVANVATLANDLTFRSFQQPVEAFHRTPNRWNKDFLEQSDVMSYNRSIPVRNVLYPRSLPMFAPKTNARHIEDTPRVSFKSFSKSW